MEQPVMFWQAIIEYVMDLITVSPKQRWTREDLLVILNCVRNDMDILTMAVTTAGVTKLDLSRALGKLETATREVPGLDPDRDEMAWWRAKIADMRESVSEFGKD